MIDLWNFSVSSMLGEIKRVGAEYILQDLLCFFYILFFQQRYDGFWHTPGYKEQGLRSGAFLQAVSFFCIVRLISIYHTLSAENVKKITQLAHKYVKLMFFRAAMGHLSQLKCQKCDKNHEIGT